MLRDFKITTWGLVWGAALLIGGGVDEAWLRLANSPTLAEPRTLTELFPPAELLPKAGWYEYLRAPDSSAAAQDAARNYRALQFDTGPDRVATSEGPWSAAVGLRNDLIALNVGSQAADYRILDTSRTKSSEAMRQELIATAQQAFTLRARDGYAALHATMTNGPENSLSLATSLSSIDYATMGLKMLGDTRTRAQIIDPLGDMPAQQIETTILQKRQELAALQGAARRDGMMYLLTTVAAMPVQ